MNHHNIEIECEKTEMELDDLDEHNIDNYLLCLPIKKEQGKIDFESNYKYYIIESNWLELNRYNKLTRSKCPWWL